MSTSPMIVYVVDDDPDSTEGLQRVLLAVGLQQKSFNSGQALLDAYPKLRPGCLFVALVMPGMSGLDLLQRLRAMGCRWPVIALGGPGKNVSTAEAIGAGAFAFLEKPVREFEVVALVRKAHAYFKSAARLVYDQEIAQRIQGLSRREREVFDCVLRARLNRQIALQLGIPESSVKSARRALMQRMQAGTNTELMVMAIRGGVAIKSRS